LFMRLPRRFAPRNDGVGLCGCITDAAQAKTAPKGRCMKSAQQISLQISS